MHVWCGRAVQTENVLVAPHRGRMTTASWLPFRVMVLTVATTVKLAFSGCVDAQPTSTTTLSRVSTSTFTSTTSTSTFASSCGGVTRCLNDTQCAQCLSSINATRSFVHTHSEYNSKSLATEREYQVGFFNTLLSTVSCSTNATPPAILHPALQELDAIPCVDEYGMAVGGCLLAESVTILPVTLPFLPEVFVHCLVCYSRNPTHPVIRCIMFDVDTHTHIHMHAHAFMVQQVCVLCSP